MKYPRLFCSLMAAVFCLTMAFGAMADGASSSGNPGQQGGAKGTLTLYKGPHWKQLYPNDPDPDNPKVNPDIDYERGTYRDGRPFVRHPNPDKMFFELSAINSTSGPPSGDLSRALIAQFSTHLPTFVFGIKTIEPIMEIRIPEDPVYQQLRFIGKGCMAQPKHIG